MYRQFFLLILFSPFSMGFTQVQVEDIHPDIHWGLVGALSLVLCLSCALVYLWILNRRLLRSKHKLSVLWHRIPDVLTEVDSNGVICALNQPLGENLSIEDIVGTSSYDYLSKEDSVVFRESLKQSLSGNIEVEYELTANFGEEKHHLNNRIVPLVTDDHEPRALVITSDITHHVEASRILQEAKQQAEDNAQSKTDFLARMSHEIRTPLGGIIGMANLLNESGGEGDLKQFSEPLLSSANHLQQIVNDVLDLAKTDSGEIQLDEVDTSLWHLLDDIEALYTPDALGKNVTLLIKVAPDVPRIIWADGFRLRQVLYNLFSNAIKFTHKGGILLAITILQIEGERVLKFSVKDTGVGVPEGCQKTIFDAFSQADAKVAKRYGGTGLGLSICKNLVEIMGGVIGIKSEENNGADFWFTLPIKEVNNDTSLNTKGIKAAIAVRDESKRSWFEAFLKAASIDCRIIKQIDSAEDQFTLLITDFLTGADVPHIWWVGLEQSPGNEGRIILYEPYRREVLFNRISDYLDLKTGEGQFLSECADANNLDYAKTRHKNIKPRIPQPENNGRSGMIEPGNLLVVEDNLTNQMVIKKTLEKMGYQVCVANNGEEGVASFLNESFQVVIMDVQMPIMDGIEATRQIRLVEDHYVPIIALTANAQDSVEEACFAAGMDAFLTKPINRAELQSTLENVLGMETSDK